MSEKRIKTTGNIFKRANGYGGTIRYVDEDGVDKRKSFSGKTKAEVKRKFKDYIINFNQAVTGGNEKYMKLKDSMQTWLECFKAPSVERTTYDRLDSMARIHIYPALGDRVLHTIKAVDIKKFLNDKKDEGYSYSTVKKMHSLFHDYFRYIMEQEILDKDPMRSVSMIKKKNFYEEEIPTCDTITVFTDEEIAKLKDECFKTWDTGKRVYQQSAAYIFMLNTGLRAGEMLGLLNSDIDLENRVVHIRQGVKEVQKRDGFEKIPGREIEVGKPKSATSKRTVPLNNTAIEMVQELRSEFYFGEDSPLVCDENGGYTRPLNFRKRFYRVLQGAGIEQKGLHSLRHTFATNLVNGIKQPDGSIKCLTPRQVADLLGHSTSEITELYYVKRDSSKLIGITDNFEM